MKKLLAVIATALFAVVAVGADHADSIEPVGVNQVSLSRLHQLVLLTGGGGSQQMQADS